MRDENLKAHCKNVHNASKRIAGEVSVENWFGTPASAKVSKISKMSSSSTSGEFLLTTGGRKTPEDLILTGPPEEEENKDIIDEAEVEKGIDLSPPPQHDKMEEAELDDNDTLKELVRIVKDISVQSGDSNHEIKRVKESIAALTAKLENKIPEFAQPEEVNLYDERIKALRDCKTIDEITETFTELVVEEETGLILCELCFTEKESHGNRNPGQFRIDLGGVEPEVDRSKQNRNFINLKKSIKRHFNTTMHTDNWKAWDEKEKAEEALNTR